MDTRLSEDALNITYEATTEAPQYVETGIACVDAKLRQLEIEEEQRLNTVNYVDDILRWDLFNIMNNGISTEGYEVRPRWADGESAHTKAVFGITNRYDVSKGLPLTSLRKTNWKAAIDEILWIWQKKSNNVNELNSKIWDAWANEEGSIGRCYGWTMGFKFIDKYGNEVDQVDFVLNQLKAHSIDRGIMTELYIHQDIRDMGLRPCVHHTQWSVQDGTLSVLVKQRSQDTIAANNWNVVQYAALLQMFAYAADLKVGELIHVIGDMHIYDRHFEYAEELMKRDSFPPAKTSFKPETRDFYRFKVEDFVVEDYLTGPQIKGIPIAE